MMIEIDTPEILIHYTPTREEIQPLLVREVLHAPMATMAKVLCTLYTVAGAVFMAIGALVPGALIISTGLAELAVLYYLANAQAKQRFAELEAAGLTQLRSLTINALGIRETTQGSDIMHFWAKFKSLRVKDNLYILPFSSDTGILVIPFRAFTSDDQRAEFTSMATNALANLAIITSPPFRTTS